MNTPLSIEERIDNLREMQRLLYAKAHDVHLWNTDRYYAKGELSGTSNAMSLILLMKESIDTQASELSQLRKVKEAVERFVKTAGFSLEGWSTFMALQAALTVLHTEGDQT